MFVKIIIALVLLVLIGGVGFFAVSEPQINQKTVTKTVSLDDIKGTPEK